MNINSDTGYSFALLHDHGKQFRIENNKFPLKITDLIVQHFLFFDTGKSYVPLECLVDPHMEMLIPINFNLKMPND